MPLQDELGALQRNLAHEFSNIQHLQEQLNFFHIHWHHPDELLFPDIAGGGGGAAADTPSIDLVRVHRDLKEEFLESIYTSLKSIFPDTDNIKLKNIFLQLHRHNRALRILIDRFQLDDFDYLDTADVLYDEHILIFCLCLCRAVFTDIAAQHPGSKQEITAWLVPCLERELHELHRSTPGSQLHMSTSALVRDERYGRDKRETWQFEHEVLLLGPGGIDKPLALEELQDHFDGPDAAEQYHNQWIPYVLEEARESIAQQVKLIRNKRPPGFKIKIAVDPGNINTDHPTVFLNCTTKKLPEIDHAFAKEAIFLLPDTSRGGTTFSPILTIVSVKFFDRHSGLHHLQVRMLKDDFVENTTLFGSTRQWEGQHLAGLIGFNRMFDACRFPAHPPFLSQITSGVLPPWPKQDLVARFQASSVEDKLNRSQFLAVSSFYQAEAGYFCLQGPPGTGKSTTAINALSVLCQDTRVKIMVGAPSNKATRSLAARTALAYPALSIALTGVGKDLPEHLQHIFVNDHAKLISNQLSAAFEPFNNAHKKLLGQIPKSRGSASKKRRDFVALIHQFCESIQDCIQQFEVLMTPTHFPLKTEAVQAIHSLIDQFSTIRERILGMAETYKAATSAFKQKRHLMPKTKHTPIPGTPQYIQYSKAEAELKQSETQLQQSFQSFCQLFHALNNQLNSCAENIEILLIQRAQIVFCTLVSSGRPWLKKHIHHFDVVVVDEASQCTVPEALIPLKFNPKKLLHIGDPRQLPATIKSRAAQDGGYGNSLMLRMMETRRQAFQVLRIQYRMHPTICRFPSRQYYGGRLLSAEGLQSRISPLAGAPIDSKYKSPSIFFDIANGREKRNVGYSRSTHNVAECNALIEMLAQLLPHLRDHTVGVITFYAAQVVLLQKALKKLVAPNKGNVTISTVDGFQGEEKDIVLLSMVRTSKDVGFLKDVRRLNVAITRPRHHLMIFGHRRSLIQSRSGVGLLAKKFGQPDSADYPLVEVRGSSLHRSGGGGGGAGR